MFFCLYPFEYTLHRASTQQDSPNPGAAVSSWWDYVLAYNLYVP